VADPKELRQFSEAGARKPVVADVLVEQGRLGQKTGRGWYRYGDDRKPIPDPEVLEVIESVARRHGIARRSIRKKRFWSERSTPSSTRAPGYWRRASPGAPADIDVIYLAGYGFPGFRGGPMFFADSVGLPRVHERVAALHREHGQRFQPAPLLARLAREGSSFREYDAQLETAEAAATRR
jgi:3-hydroxyacyl-CoA dehydrogenase